MAGTIAPDLDWLAQVNPQVHLAWSGTWRPGTVEPLRTLLDHELVVFDQGVCVVEIEGVGHACPAGTFLVVPPGRRHLTRAGAHPVLRHCVHFDWHWQGPPPRAPIFSFWPERMAASRLRRAPRFVPRWPLHGAVPVGSPVPDLLRTVALRWNRGDDTERRSCRALLLDALVRLLAPPAPPAPADAGLGLALAVRELLDDLDPNTTSIQAALGGLGRSYEHCCRSFRSRFGISPLRYVNAVRLERAKRLLVEDDASVAAIAARAGFRDPGYFARQFRAYTGTTPARFRATRGGEG